MTKSKNAGASIENAEVTSISRHGFWLYLGGRELFVDFREFPWFADAPVSKIMKVRWPSPDHLQWPELDVDLSVESIEHPEKFPLLFDPSV
jgi:hypothetical protein